MLATYQQRSPACSPPVLCFCFFFFGRPRACGVPGSGIIFESQFRPKPQQQQRHILNPLCWAGDGTPRSQDPTNPVEPQRELCHQVLSQCYCYKKGTFSLDLLLIKMAMYSSSKCSINNNLFKKWLEKKRDGKVSLCSFILTTQFNLFRLEVQEQTSVRSESR